VNPLDYQLWKRYVSGGSSMSIVVDCQEANLTDERSPEMKQRLVILPLRSIAIRVAVGGALLLSGCAEIPLPGGPRQGAASLQAAQFTYPPFDGLKKRLAVLRFDNKVKTPIPDASWQIGEGLTEMLTSELFKTGRFIMVERAALADIVKEQELGQTGLVRKETAAKVGELLGAQLLITGAVTEFEAQARGGGGGVGYGGFALKLQTQSAHVAVDMRLVDASTAQILSSLNAEASASQTGLGFAATIKGVDFGSDAFQNTPLGQATREAMQKAVMFIIKEMEPVPWTGRVVQVKDTDVYVNAGTNVNLKPGVKLAAYVKGEDLIDPVTGLNLGSKDTLIGTVTVTDVQDKFSIGSFVGDGALKRGDLVRFQSTPLVSSPPSVVGGK
jgi:curli biogenesis system outer membrane secretion channel CsgG